MVNLDFGCPLSIVLLAEQITLLEFSVLSFKSNKPGKHFQKAKLSFTKGTKSKKSSNKGKFLSCIKIS